jgi:hypothetical protein
VSAGFVLPYLLLALRAAALPLLLCACRRQDPRDAEDAVKELHGFQGWVS